MAEIENLLRNLVPESTGEAQVLYRAYLSAGEADKELLKNDITKSLFVGLQRNLEKNNRFLTQTQKTKNDEIIALLSNPNQAFSDDVIESTLEHIHDVYAENISDVLEHVARYFPEQKWGGGRRLDPPGLAAHANFLQRLPIEDLALDSPSLESWLKKVKELSDLADEQAEKNPDWVESNDWLDGEKKIVLQDVKSFIERVDRQLEELQQCYVVNSHPECYHAVDPEQPQNSTIIEGIIDRSIRGIDTHGGLSLAIKIKGIFDEERAQAYADNKTMLTTPFSQWTLVQETSKDDVAEVLKYKVGVDEVEVFVSNRPASNGELRADNFKQYIASHQDETIEEYANSPISQIEFEISSYLNINFLTVIDNNVKRDAFKSAVVPLLTEEIMRYQSSLSNLSNEDENALKIALKRCLKTPVRNFVAEGIERSLGTVSPQPTRLDIDSLKLNWAQGMSFVTRVPMDVNLLPFIEDANLRQFLYLYAQDINNSQILSSLYYQSLAYSSLAPDLDDKHNLLASIGIFEKINGLDQLTTIHQLKLASVNIVDFLQELDETSRQKLIIFLENEEVDTLISMGEALQGLTIRPKNILDKLKEIGIEQKINTFSGEPNEAHQLRMAGIEIAKYLIQLSRIDPLKGAKLADKIKQLSDGKLISISNALKDLTIPAVEGDHEKDHQISSMVRRQLMMQMLAEKILTGDHHQDNATVGMLLSFDREQFNNFSTEYKGQEGCHNKAEFLNEKVAEYINESNASKGEETEYVTQLVQHLRDQMSVQPLVREEEVSDDDYTENVFIAAGPFEQDLLDIGNLSYGQTGSDY